MAKPKVDFLVEEVEDLNLLRVWAPALVSKVGIIETIEGVSSVWYSALRDCLDVWLNPCYDGGELIAEIRAALESACMREEMT